MIFQLENYNIKLDKNNNCYTIYTYEKIILRPNELKSISLPYCRQLNGKYFNFELDYNLARNNVQVLWHNLNLNESAENSFNFLIKSNMNEILLNNDVLGYITGKNNVNIKSGEIFGRIFI